MKVIHSVVFVAASILLAATAMAGTPKHGQPAHGSAPANTATPAKHPVHLNPVAAATKEKLDAIKAEYGEKRTPLEAELKTEQGNLKKLEHARPRDESAVKQARTELTATRAKLRELRKQEHAEIAKVLAEAAHARPHANSASAKSSGVSAKPHKTPPSSP